jgi:hypothetical protein
MYGPSCLIALAWLFIGALSACANNACDYERGDCPTGQVCAFIDVRKSQCVPTVDSPKPLSPPFRPGHEFWCSQGGKSGAGRSHSFAGDIFAMDLVSTSPSDVEVVSPVDGTAYVFDDCEERDSRPNAYNNSRCGLGYGNHVKIWDGTNVYLFGHLARVLVKPGPIHRDQVIGIMGCSGAAPHRHVHLAVSRPSGPKWLSDTRLRFPGKSGGVPVRFRMAANRDSFSEWVDRFPCNDSLENARAFVR